MKKLLFVLAIGAFVACGESAEGDANMNDTVPPTIDTNTVAPVDTATAPAAADTTASGTSAQ